MLKATIFVPRIRGTKIAASKINTIAQVRYLGAHSNHRLSTITSFKASHVKQLLLVASVNAAGRMDAGEKRVVALDDSLSDPPTDSL